MNILLTGATGFIGNHLVRALLTDGHQLTILTRAARSGTRNVSYLPWNGTEMPLGMGHFDAVINLAGASLAEGKWTPERKQTIIDSRVRATEACVQYINRSNRPPAVFVSASAVGYYGGLRAGQLDESATPGSDFLAEVCLAWEQAAQGANCRTAIVRIGVVLGQEGGAFPKLSQAFRAFVGGPMAGGEQPFPWIHIADVVGAIRFLLYQQACSGVYNLAAPETLTNAQFSRTLAQTLKRPMLFSVPKFALERLLGEQSVLLWGGQQAIPAHLLHDGYQFQFSTAQQALQNLV